MEKAVIPKTAMQMKFFILFCFLFCFYSLFSDPEISPAHSCVFGSIKVGRQILNVIFFL